MAEPSFQEPPMTVILLGCDLNPGSAGHTPHSYGVKPMTRDMFSLILGLERGRVLDLKTKENITPVCESSPDC